jgi:hypothetical protein
MPWPSRTPAWKHTKISSANPICCTVLAKLIVSSSFPQRFWVPGYLHHSLVIISALGILHRPKAGCAMPGGAAMPGCCQGKLRCQSDVRSCHTSHVAPGISISVSLLQDGQ